jgi:hypothetical protein
MMSVVYAECKFMMSVAVTSAIMLSVDVTSAIMLSVAVASAIMLIVMVPYKTLHKLLHILMFILVP